MSQIPTTAPATVARMAVPADSTIDREVRVKSALVVCLAALTLVFSMALAQHGHITVDEVVYHLMARSFANAGSLAILNGYQEFPSFAYSFPVTHEIGERLVSQYPALYPMLTAPFYWLAGYKGLFLFNALAFVGVVGLCYATAQLMFRDRSMALNACLLLFLATYAWEYSQATWPHSTGMLFVWGAFYLAARAYFAQDTRRAIALAGAAGLIAGAGVGVRVDVFLVAPALVLPFLLAMPARPWQAAAVCLGAIPTLAAIAAINQAKFGIFSPFSYGPKPSGSPDDPLSYLPVVLAGIALLVLVRTFQEPAVRAFAARHWRWCAIAACLATGLMLAHPVIWALVARLGEGAYQLLIDIRIRDLDTVDPASARGPGGSLIYMGSLKKSLLQSCPYLVVLALPLLTLAKGRKDTPGLGFLFLLVASFLAPFIYFSWHGGLSLNLRYFLPILPATSILAAYAWREIATRSGVWGSRPAAIGTVLGIGVFFAIALTPFHRISIEAAEALLLSLPLVLAGGIAVILLVWAWHHGHLRVPLSRALAIALFAAFAWSGAIALAYDAPRAWAKRGISVMISQEIDEVVPPEAAVLGEVMTPFGVLQEQEGIRLADMARDDFASLPALVNFHLQAGRPVFGWFRPENWEAVRDRGLLAGVTTVERKTVARWVLKEFVPDSALGPDGVPQRPGSKPNLNDTDASIRP